MSTPIPRPFDARMLAVGDGHWLYVEEVGIRGGVPVLFLHGGPGSGAQHAHRLLFDPERHHAILFDQRGAGRSHPYLGLSANTTGHLVADIEIIRRHFNIERWFIAGGSWGSTLGIAYAQAHPQRVAGLVLRAIFLGTAREVAWAFIDGPKLFRPDLYNDFISPLTAAERADPLTAYLNRIAHSDPEIAVPAARIWHAYERALSEIKPAAIRIDVAPNPKAQVPPTPILEAHYIRNNFFLGDNQLLGNAHRLAGVPGTLIQGRYDLLCPPKNAHALAAAWPGCRLTLVEGAGHAMSEAGVMGAMRSALLELTSARSTT